MWSLLKVILLAGLAGHSSCTIGGLTFMDQIELKPSKPNECNPLYWYPRHIPDHCYKNDTTPPRPLPQPIPVPIPVQIPNLVHPFPPFVPLGPPLPPYVMPMPLPIPMAPYAGMYGMPPQPPPPPPGPPPPPNSCYCPPCTPFFLLPPPTTPNPCACPPCPPCPPLGPPGPIPISGPIPMGVPLDTGIPMVPIPGIPGPIYSSPHYNMAPPYGARYPNGAMGMVPGLPGLVSPDGGINVLPFSDAYADILETHKNKEFRRKYRNLIKRYHSDGSWRRRHH